MKVNFIEEVGRRRIAGFMGFDNENEVSDIGEKKVTMYDSNTKRIRQNICGLFISEFQRLDMMQVGVEGLLICHYFKISEDHSQNYFFEGQVKRYTVTEINGILRNEDTNLRVPEQQFVHKLKSDDIKEILSHSLRSGHFTEQIRSNLSVYR